MSQAQDPHLGCASPKVQGNFPSLRFPFVNAAVCEQITSCDRVTSTFAPGIAVNPNGNLMNEKWDHYRITFDPENAYSYKCCRLLGPISSTPVGSMSLQCDPLIEMNISLPPSMPLLKYPPKKKCLFELQWNDIKTMIQPLIPLKGGKWHLFLRYTLLSCLNLKGPDGTCYVRLL